MPLNVPLLLCLSVALLVVVLALVREIRLRRALQALLSRLLRSGDAMTLTRILPLILITVLMTSGCRDDEAAHVAHVAEEALRSQAEQNQKLIRLNEQIVVTSQQLVEQDAAARNEILKAQRDIQTQQSDLNTQRDSLEAERRTISAQRRTESVLAPILLYLGTALLCLLPVAVACYALQLARYDVPDLGMLNQILIEDLVADAPRLHAPAQPRLESHAPASHR